MPDISATLFLQLVAILAAALVIFNQAMIALGKRKSPNPLTVAMAEKLEDKFVSHGDHQALARKVDANHAKVEAELKEMQAEGKSDREKLYNKLNSIGMEVASQRKADEFTQAMIARLETKVDRLNERKADKS